MLWYWIEMQDAGMPMPAALISMPMPSYEKHPDPDHCFSAYVTVAFLPVRQ
jgi:hypothetical protein